MNLTEKQKNQYWSGHFRTLSRIGTGIVGRKIVVVRTAEDIGFTTPMKNGVATIHLNPNDESVPEEMPNASKLMDGVFIHEIGHQLFTDFLAHENFMTILKKGNNYPLSQWCNDVGVEPFELKRTATDDELELFHDIWNMVEDTSIEYWIFQTIGGEFPKALRYAIATTYKEGESLDEMEDPISQVMCAMIQYGDVGLLKGTFTFPEARDYFLKIQPIYDTAIEEPNARKRIMIAYQIFEELRPLWEPMLQQKEMMRKMLDALKDMIGDNGHEGQTSKGSHSSNANNAGSGNNSRNNSTNKRKSKTIEMTRKEFEDLKKNSSKSGSGGETVNVKIVDDKDEKDSKNSGDSGKKSDSSDSTEKSNNNGSESTNENQSGEQGQNSNSKNSGENEDSAENSEKNGDSSSSNNSKTSNDSSDSSSDSKSESNGSEAGNDSQGDSNSQNNSGDKSNQNSSSDNSDDDMQKPTEPQPDLEYQVVDDIVDDADYSEEVWEEAQISDEEADEINKKIEQEIHDEELFEKRESNEDDIWEFSDIKGRGFTNASCKNIVEEAPESLDSGYMIIVDQMKPEITRLASQLKRAAEKPNTIKVKKSSGTLNVGRYSKINACQTTKLFDKRRTPDKNDIAVFVNVDESGSMSGDKIMTARKVCIAIAEACAIAKIPIYVMGFTGDVGSWDAYHLHYVRWKNTKKERLSLMNISARSCNFDGYSIRYSTKILQKRSESSKLLVVISDGQPASRRYSDGFTNVGVADTKDAVRQATSDGIVVHGIAIAGRSNSVLKEIYGANFTDVDDLSTLFNNFSNAILKQLKKGW